LSFYDRYDGNLEKPLLRVPHFKKGPRLLSYELHEHHREVLDTVKARCQAAYQRIPAIKVPG